MVVTSAPYTQSRYRAGPGEGFDGVVRVSFTGVYASGVLLYDGRVVITAAHLFEGHSGTATVTFETAAGTQTVNASGYLLHPTLDAQGNHDLALVWLGGAAPVAATRHDLYRTSDELGRAFTMVGYGQTGVGATGVVAGGSETPQRLRVSNQFDAESSMLKAALGTGMVWTPAASTQLVADFDNGTVANDALGQLIGRAGLGMGADEGLIAQGDSGGPAFIDGRVAGIASYLASLVKDAARPDIDGTTNSSFGEIAAWQRISHYQQWIDQSLRAAYTNAPTRPEDVRKSVAEGASGTSLAYFLVQFSGIRSSADAVLSVDYATRDGTARAGSDYLATSGTLKLYPGENQAVVAVEVVGDTVAEPEEQFHLDVTNPIGGSFGPGVVRLTAVRTILDDDGWIG